MQANHTNHHPGNHGGRPVILLGFDYGERNIGVAVGQSLTGEARPLVTLRARNHKPDWDGITKLIETWRPKGLVVGLPLKMDGGEQEMSHAARRFSRQLNGRYHLPVHTMDERLSTYEARGLLRDWGDRNGERDPVAAQLILETWFTENIDS